MVLESWVRQKSKIVSLMKYLYNTVAQNALLKRDQGGKTQTVLTIIYFIKMLALCSSMEISNAFACICLRIREAEEG